MLPAHSEVVLAGLVAAGHEPWALWAWASAGNTAGAALNWLLGRFLLHYSDRRWFPIEAERLQRAQAWVGRRGAWILLLAWAPVVGDALTFAAGVMRVRFPLFLVLVFTGKAARYGVILGAVQAATGQS